MRVLFVTLHNILGEINNGGNQCTERNLKLLRRIYHEENVDLCVAMEEIPNYQDRQEVYTIPLMKSRSVEFIAGLMLHIDFTQSAEERVCELVRKNKYDMVFFDNTKFGRIIRKLKKDKTIPGKIVVFAHNELENEKVKVIGSVESLTAYLQSAGAVVMPIFYGSGMKVKTAEAIMHGKRIFATTEALAGYEIAEYGMTCCNDEESFVRAILHYFEEEKIQREIREVRQVFLQYYDTDNYEKSLADVLERNDG